MTTFSYIITDEQGIHARPAGLLVKAAKSFNSNITIESKGSSADLKKLFAVMGLGVKKGDVIIVSCDGQDEGEASAVLESLLQSHL